MIILIKKRIAYEVERINKSLDALVFFCQEQMFSLSFNRDEALYFVFYFILNALLRV